MNIRCPNCGAEQMSNVSGVTNFCWSCGYALSNGQGPVSSNHLVPAGDLPYDPNLVSTQRQDLSVVPNQNMNPGVVPNPNMNLSAIPNPYMSYSMVPNPNMYSGAAGSPNLIISYYSAHPRVFLIVRVVSTGYKKLFVSGESSGYCLLPGPQTLILKIGKRNYRRDIVIRPSGEPVRIQASWSSGVARINILDYARNPIPPFY